MPLGCAYLSEPRLDNFLIRSASADASSGVFGRVLISPKLPPLVNAAFGFVGAGLGTYAAGGNEWIAAPAALVGAVAGYLLTHKIPS